MALHRSPRKIKASKEPGAVSLWIHVIIHNHKAEDNGFPSYHLAGSSSVAVNLIMISTIILVNMLQKNELAEPLTTSSRVFPVKDVRLNSTHPESP